MRALSIQTRELFANLLRREIRGRYKGSWLGVVWTLIIPLLMMATYTLVFSVIFKVVDIPHYPLYLMTGLALWVFFGNSIVVAASSLLANADLVKKVRFPRVLVPIATVASQALTAGVIVVALIPLNLAVMPGNRATVVLLPVVIMFTAMMVIGVSLAVAAINVYFRDVEHILTALLLPWFFLTPIFYTFASFPLATHPWVIDLLTVVNFVTPFVLAFQDVLFWGLWPSPWILGYIAVVGVGFLLGGLWVFRKLQRDLAIEL